VRTKKRPHGCKSSEVLLTINTDGTADHRRPSSPALLARRTGIPLTAPVAGVVAAEQYSYDPGPELFRAAYSGDAAIEGSDDPVCARRGVTRRSLYTDVSEFIRARYGSLAPS